MVPRLLAKVTPLFSRFQRTLPVEAVGFAEDALYVPPDPPDRSVASGDGASATLEQRAPDPDSATSAGTSVAEMECGFEWPSPLKDYQLAGISALIANDRLLLADDMGLGKTIQAIAAIRVMFSKGAIQRALLIVPASLLVQWRAEFAKWAPELSIMPVKGVAHDRGWQWETPADVTLVSYETFRSDFGLRGSKRLLDQWDLVVIDEAQKIKNRGSEVSRKIKRIRRLRSWALTGTPLENRTDDLTSILEFVDHAPDGTSQHFTTDEAMLHRHKQVQLRRSKSEVLEELPAKQIIKLSLDLPPPQMAAYRRAEAEGIVQIRSHGPSVRITHVLELILRLKQICNVDPVSNESAKLTDIRDRMQVLVDEGHRALVFSQFVNQFGVETAVEWLSAFRPLAFTGSLDAPARQATVSRFKEHDKHKALILSLRAGGVGLNLQEASYVFHLDRWWNPAVERQAEDRAHRLGQHYPVTVYHYVCTNTIEERIDRIIAEKQALFDDLVDDVSLDLGSVLTSREIFGLFDIEPPPAQHRARRPANPSLVARCTAFFRAYGWDIASGPVRRGRFDVLVSCNIDAVGLVQSLEIWCVEQTAEITVDDVRFVLANTSGGGIEVVLVTTAEISAEVEMFAAHSKIRIWHSKTIARFDHVPGSRS